MFEMRAGTMADHSVSHQLFECIHCWYRFIIERKDIHPPIHCPSCGKTEHIRQR